LAIRSWPVGPELRERPQDLLEVVVGTPQGGLHPVTLRHGLLGNHLSVSVVPLAVLQERRQLLARAVVGVPVEFTPSTRVDLTVPTGGAADQQPPRHRDLLHDTGQILFDVLFGESREQVYRAARDKALKAHLRLRIALRVADPDVACLPWEAMTDGVTGEQLARDHNLVRLATRQGSPALLPPVEPPLRVLCVLSAPRGEGWIDVESEQKRIEEHLQEPADRGLVLVTYLRQATFTRIQRALLPGWDVVHFIGHGRSGDLGIGEVSIETDRGDTRWIPAGRFAELVASTPVRPQFVVLNFCSSAVASTGDPLSSVAAAVLHKGVPAVAGMQFQVLNLAAEAFAGGLYASIIEGQDLADAVRAGRTAVLDVRGDAGSFEWISPVLYLHDPGLVSLVPRTAAPHGTLLPQEVDTAPAPAAPRRAGVPRQRRPGTLGRRGLAATGALAIAGMTGAGLVALNGSGAERPTPFIGVLAGHHDGAVLRMVYSPDGGTLASVSADGTLRRWDSATGHAVGAPVRNPEGAMAALAYSADGRLMACAGAGGTVWVLRTDTEAVTQQFRSGAEDVTALAFANDLLLTADAAGHVRVWATLTSAGTFGVTPLRSIDAASAAVTALDVVDHGETVLTGDRAGYLRRWRIRDGVALPGEVRQPAGVLDVAVAEDGATVAAAGADGLIRLGDLHVPVGFDWSEPLDGHPAAVHGVAFDPEGSLLVSVSDAEPRPAPPAPRSSSAAPSGSRSRPPKGRRPTAAAPTTRATPASPTATAGEAPAAASAPGYGDGSLLVWDALTGAELASPDLGHGAALDALAFSPWGHGAVALGSVDGTVQVRQVGIRPPSRDVVARLGVELGNGTGVTPGALIRQILPDTPATDMKLRVGDLIVRVGQRRVVDSRQVAAAIGEMEPGTRTSVVVVRDGREVPVMVTLTRHTVAAPADPAPAAELT
jgi:WD40 repeat protein